MAEANHQATIEAALGALNEHDLDKFVQFMGPTYAVFAVGLRGGLKGADAVRDFVAMLLVAFPDLELKSVKLETSSPLTVYQEVVLHGTHVGPLPLPDGSTVTSTVETVVVPAEMFHRFDSMGRLVDTTVHLDLEALDQQLGLK